MTNSANLKRKIHFEPDNLDIIVNQGANLLQAAIDAGVHINASCGGTGVCSSCKVLIKNGKVDSIKTINISQEEYEHGLRQACQSHIITDLNVYIPIESRLEKTILSHESIRIPAALATGWAFKPPVNKYYINLPPPTMEDNISDLSRLLRGLKQQCALDNVSTEFPIIKKITRILRDGDWNVTVTTMSDDEQRLVITNIEPGDTREKHYSLAFDIGTTAIRGELLDLNRGEILAQGSDYNGQIRYGEDVITRIVSSQKTNGLQKLQQAVVATLNKLIRQLLAQSQIDADHLGYMVIAANTTMSQLLLGLDPKYIRLAPYTPTADFLPVIKAKHLGIEVGEHVHLYILPSVASYVGGDIVSGIVGSGIYQSKKLTYYIDIGTNGEIVVGNSDWMVTASCSAGPAFEGGGIKHGIIATAGAIESFSINPSTLEPLIGTIAEKKPKGICGSGLINIIAGLLEAGIITPNGKFITGLPTNRIRKGTDGYEYVLSWAKETQIGKDIVITEVD
ncbi:MAG: ASKHA domain-containing protein, partial [Dehalococcoidales bacterium]|nr:ASKHA domain-containing protein [Dehalococcoidales bacterium]